jgi:hypothetical protein
MAASAIVLRVCQFRVCIPFYFQNDRDTGYALSQAWKPALRKIKENRNKLAPADDT